MSETNSARESAARLRRYRDGEDPLTIWPEMRESVAKELGKEQPLKDGLVRHFGTERFAAADYEELGDAVLADPASLLPAPVWRADDEAPDAGACWESIIGTYYICVDWDEDNERYLETCTWGCNGQGRVYDQKAPSLDAAKSACFADFQARVRACFETKTGE